MNDKPNIMLDNIIYVIIKFMLLNIPKNANATLINTVKHMLIVMVYTIFSIIEYLLKYL